jgi:DNA-binding Lrp family transcriptional regulator
MEKRKGKREMQMQGIDAVDRRITALLREDGRMSYSDLGAAVGLSRTAVKARVDALEARGIIKGYRAVIDLGAAEENATVFIVRVETRPDSFEKCKHLLAQAEETVTLVQTTGGCQLTAFCLASDARGMRDFLGKICQSAEGVLSVCANSVIDVVKGSLFPA